MPSDVLCVSDLVLSVCATRHSFTNVVLEKVSNSIIVGSAGVYFRKILTNKARLRVRVHIREMYEYTSRRRDLQCPLFL